MAGNGSSGYSGDGGVATSAQLYWPTGVAVDKYGNVFIADQFNNVIRKVDTSNIISTYAGTGSVGFSGDSGLATLATMWHPQDVAVDTFGNVYIIDMGNQRVRKVDVAGIITTIAGNGVPGFAGDSGLAVSAMVNFPQGIAVDKHRNVFIADFYNNRVRKIDSSGYIYTIAGNGIGGFSGDDSIATSAALFNPSALAVNDSGDIFISDYSNNRIRKVNTHGIITTIAGTGVGGYSGDGGLATSAEIFWPEGIAVDSTGNVFIADYNNHVVREVIKPTSPVDSTASVAAFSLNSLLLLPNPSTGKFTLLSRNDHDNKIVEVYDILGIQVFYSHFATEAVVDIADRPAGMYYVYIKSANKTSILRVVKN